MMEGDMGLDGTTWAVGETEGLCLSWKSLFHVQEHTLAEELQGGVTDSD